MLGFFARILGSPRGRMGVGIVVACIGAAFGIIFLFVERAIAGIPSLVWLLAPICVTFVVFRLAFRLPAGRAWALVGIFAIWSALVFVLAFFVMRPYVLEAFVIPAPSMSPTIEPGERIVAQKVAKPRRWDLVVFRHLEQDGTTRAYCKRLVGLPGERLQFKDGTIYVDDHATTAPPVVAGRYHASPFQPPKTSDRYQDGQTIVLAGDQYFVVGDNVNRSIDSRIWGPIDASSLVGVVDLKYWPLNRIQIFR